MKMKWVLVSQRKAVGKHGDPQDVLENSYVEYLERFGFLVFPVPNVLQRLDLFLERAPEIDGIFITGGNDVDPSDYGEEKIGSLCLTPDRDSTERALLDYAVSAKIPVFGICRGAQFINVYFGGRVVQNMKKLMHRDGHQSGTEHSIEIVDEKVRNYLEQSTIQANSYHEHSLVIEGLPPVLKPFAVERKAEIVEGFYHLSYPIAAVQFHPERSPEDLMGAALMKAFRDRELFWEEKK